MPSLLKQLHLKVAPKSTPEWAAVKTFVETWLSLSGNERVGYLRATLSPKITPDGTVSASDTVAGLRAFGGIGRAFRRVAESWPEAERAERMAKAAELFGVPSLDEMAASVIQVGSMLSLIPGDLQGTVEGIMEHRARR